VETGAMLVATNASPVAAAAGAPAVAMAGGRYPPQLLSATGVTPVLLRLPPAREGRRAETGATLVETIASPVAAAAGALETINKYALDREWWRISLMGKTGRRVKK
jgi:hypothetical protein